MTVRKLLLSFSGGLLLIGSAVPAALSFNDLAGPRGVTLSHGEDEAEDAAVEQSAPATFDDVISGVDGVLDGNSIEQLINGTPIFAPIEGLPEAVWKEKACSTCHDWNRERLCTQGEFYGKQGLGAVDRKQHPYGGAFKRAVTDWAAAGCK